VSWKNNSTFEISINLPDGVSAQVELPAKAGSSGVFQGTAPVAAHRVGARWRLDREISGKTVFEVK
jgi:hypothetical protein